MSEFIQWLLQNGWSKSIASLEMISPQGKRYSLETINALDPIFQKAKHDSHQLDALKYAVPLQPGTSPRVHPQTSSDKVWSPYEMLKMRLHIKASETFGMDYCNIHEGPNTTFVFLVKGEKSIVLEDNTHMFPSDALVAAFRLFQQAVE